MRDQVKLTVIVGKEVAEIPVTSKTAAKKIMAAAMSYWRRNGKVRCNGVPVAEKTPFSRGWTATWNEDYTAATLRYGSSKYVAGIIRVVLA